MFFLVEDEERLRAKLAKASVAAKVKWNQMRVSPSIFNRQEDIDRLLEALSWAAPSAVPASIRSEDSTVRLEPNLAQIVGQGYGPARFEFRNPRHDVARDKPVKDRTADTSPVDLD